MKSTRQGSLESLKDIPGKGSAQLVSIKMYINEQLDKRIQEFKKRGNIKNAEEVERDKLIIHELME